MDEPFAKFNERRAVNKAVGPRKKSTLINIGPTFNPDNRVLGRNV